ncbi:uncharacterized protein KD926_001620 [Aspergillus affinis]|uniref:uncharacterized protein n=1 Tax=Aspergillus affinis TaxID=1070780 RepID=UPI0022FE68B4|nr:uncharacterized protein KD926_001620 [Aspergillus affinis]KAI9036607.1 hypothetical protein KD926_001620 [Aspergillus affinis]
MLIYRLPLEIWELILRELPLPDHLALRLTNKYVSHQCSGPFFRLPISRDRSVVLTRKSLDSLHALASHPTFGSVVTTIYISACALKVDLQAGTLTPAFSNHVPESGVSDAQPDSTHESLLRRRENIERFREEIADVSDRFVAEWLEATFRAFRRMDNVLIFMESQQARHGWGGTNEEFEELEESPPEEHDINSDQFARTCFLSMCAILKSDIPVQSLYIGNTIGYRSLSQQILEEPFKLFPSETLVESLEELGIHTWISEASRESQISISPKLQSWSKSIDAPAATPISSSFASNLCNLKRLYLHMNFLDLPITNSKPCPDFLEHIHSPNLESLTFVYFKMSASFLLSFLKKHPKLREIELSEIDLSEGDWKEALDFLHRDMPNLKELRVI